MLFRLNLAKLGLNWLNLAKIELNMLFRLKFTKIGNF